ncbi:MAG: hypothetical protein EOO07_22580 [Chitinophagaceae bacterium]|nr:MAG: hypothetical protein EOO07_22580 [Chitinophagaceae bacterium]
MLNFNLSWIMSILCWQSLGKTFWATRKQSFASKALAKLFFVSIFLVLINENVFATIPRGSEPAPPRACLVGGILYTTYIRTVYSPDNSSANIDGYRYIFSGSGAKVTCISSTTLFMGPDPSNSWWNIAIGCDIDKTLYSQTSHNDSIANYVACPIDSQTFILLSIIGIIGFVSIKRPRFDLAISSLSKLKFV